MIKKFKDLKPESIAILEPLAKFWSGGRLGLDLEKSIDDKLDVLTTDAGLRYCAEYAVTYAVLLDDKELIKDLCENGVKLDVKDEFHSSKTPLEIAVEYGRVGIIDILMRYGAQVPNDIKVPSGNPCIHPLTFFWTLKERTLNREADFEATSRLVCGSKKTD